MSLSASRLTAGSFVRKPPKAASPLSARLRRHYLVAVVDSWLKATQPHREASPQAVFCATSPSCSTIASRI
ncbi:hypothetical protein, partial [Mesorhizobium sp. M7A.F.Ca.MR.362.00.0.0]|uniref:hypothetical protein n=1 Tax=Mesorhizobium sp. M7A.F.Ca.MR.362.00.0.0 TaxID=2496779 RepID=UPI0019D4703B